MKETEIGLTLPKPVGASLDRIEKVIPISEDMRTTILILIGQAMLFGYQRWTGADYELLKREIREIEDVFGAENED